jgi:hypothetical protein
MIYKFANILYDKKLALIAPLLYSIYYPFHIWTTGGLETSLFVLLLLSGVYYSYIESQNPSKRVLISILFFILLVLTRPEGILYFCLVEGIILFYHYIIKKEKAILFQRFFSLLAIGIIYLIYFIWKITYYGEFLPNSFQAKAGFNIFTQKGIRYLSFFLIFTSPIIILAIIGLFKMLVEIEGKMLNDNSFRTIIFLLTPIIINFLIVLSISKFNAAQGFRFILPAMPFIILLALHPIKALINKSLEEIISLNLNIKHIVFQFTPFVLLISLIIFPMTSPLIHTNTSNTDVNEKFYKLAGWINENVPDEDLIAFTDMGIIPYYTDNEYLDIWGLLDEHIAEEGLDIEYILSKNATLIILKEVFSGTKQIRQDDDFQENYELLYIIKMEEITQYLQRKEYNMWIYKEKSFDISNQTFNDYF